MALALACLAAYLLGGIPFGLLLARVFAGVDIRTIGSGNVGATNAARAFASKRQRLAMFVLIYVLDAAKGFAPTFWLPAAIGQPGANVAALIGSCAVVGHCFSPYLRLRGGKGVATGCGVFAAIEPWALLVALVGFAVAYAVARKVFVGSLALGVVLAGAVVLRDPASAFASRAAVSALAIAVAGFFFFTHRGNLRQALGRGARA
ncbi:MAG: glycerol-3-phosphate acyltransferase [Planctomycetota bacterium]